MKVIANGRTVFDVRVRKDLRTLLTWAARDYDRTMLFGAELHIDPGRLPAGRASSAPTDDWD